MLPAQTRDNKGHFQKLPIRYEGTALIIDETCSLEDYQRIGETLQRMERAVQFWVGDWMRFGERKWGESYTQAIEATGYTYQALADMKYVADRFLPETRKEGIPFSIYRELAPLPLEKAEALLKDAEEAGKPLTRPQIRAEVREYKAGERRKQYREQALGESKLGTFAVIYADPPWPYDFAETDSRNIDEQQYPTMEVEAIAAMPVADIAQEDAVLFLWATAPKLLEALQVMASWGFLYRTHIIWDKEAIGMGYYARGRHELLLIGKRGNLPVPDPSTRPASIISSPRQGHSQKPDVFYDIIEGMYPDLPAVELFSRAQRTGWTMWGFEAPAAVQVAEGVQVIEGPQVEETPEDQQPATTAARKPRKRKQVDIEAEDQEPEYLPALEGPVNELAAPNGSQQRVIEGEYKDITPGTLAAGFLELERVPIVDDDYVEAE